MKENPCYHGDPCFISGGNISHHWALERWMCQRAHLGFFGVKWAIYGYHGNNTVQAEAQFVRCEGLILRFLRKLTLT